MRVEILRPLLAAVRCLRQRTGGFVTDANGRTMKVVAGCRDWVEGLAKLLMALVVSRGPFRWLPGSHVSLRSV